MIELQDVTKIDVTDGHRKGMAVVAADASKKRRDAVNAPLHDVRWRRD